MNDPIIKAKWVVETYSIMGIPALSLEAVAKTERIKYLLDGFPDDPFAGMLLFKGTKRKIIVNTHIPNPGRHRFTFAHELGHYFLEHPPSYSQDGKSGFRCTADDIEKEHKPREIEANHFAVEFLMPEDDFRLNMAGAPIDFELIGGLSNKYMVSKHACSNRILGITQAPCIIIRTNGVNITGVTYSRAARGFLRDIKTLPLDTAAYTVVAENRWFKDFMPCEKEKWLCHTIPSEVVYESTHIHRESGVAMTIIKW